MRTTAAVLLLMASGAIAQSAPARLRFEISFPATQSAAALDGRVLLAISADDKREPRFQIEEQEAKSQQLFGVDVEALKPGAPAVIDASVLGYPVRSLDQLPAGDYYVQAVLNVYESFTRADGHVVKLPPDQGEGQQWNRKPGNLYSKPVKMHIDPTSGATIRVSLAEKIPPIDLPKDSKYVKYVRIQSPLLSAFWGRPMFIAAFVAVPEDSTSTLARTIRCWSRRGTSARTSTSSAANRPRLTRRTPRWLPSSDSSACTRTGRRAGSRMSCWPPSIIRRRTTTTATR